MTSEEEVVLLQEELEAAREVLARCQAECSSTKRLLSKKVQSLIHTSEARTQTTCTFLI